MQSHIKNIAAVLLALAMIIALAFAFATPSKALTGDAARFDFTNGQPTTVDNTTSTCTGQATIRYDFTLGMPTGVYDTTATCTAAAAGGAIVSELEVWEVKGGAMIVRGGSFIIR